MSETVAPELQALHDAVVGAFAHDGKTLTVDRRFSFQVMRPQGLRIFFHWPAAIEAAVSLAAEGAALGTVTAPSADSAHPTNISRAGLLYTDAGAAQDASIVLQEWMVDALIADATVTHVERAAVPQLGDEVLWSLTGVMTRGDGSALQRADLAWRRGRTVACVVAFADGPSFDMCMACAAELDARIDSSERD